MTDDVRHTMPTKNDDDDDAIVFDSDNDCYWFCLHRNSVFRATLNNLVVLLALQRFMVNEIHVIEIR